MVRKFTYTFGIEKNIVTQQRYFLGPTKGSTRGGDSHIKSTGVLVENFEKNP